METLNFQMDDVQSISELQQYLEDNFIENVDYQLLIQRGDDVMSGLIIFSQQVLDDKYIQSFHQD